MKDACSPSSQIPSDVKHLSNGWLSGLPPSEKGWSGNKEVLSPLCEVIEGSEGPWPGQAHPQGHGHGRTIKEVSPELPCFSFGLFGDRPYEFSTKLWDEEWNNFEDVSLAIFEAQKSLKLLLALGIASWVCGREYVASFNSFGSHPSLQCFSVLAVWCQECFG